MRILLVDDDYLEENLVRKILTDKTFKIPDEEIVTITTEAEFRERIPEIARSPRPPELVIMDVMIRWTDRKPGDIDMAQVPGAVGQEGPYRAGLRCAEMLDQLNPNIPILFYTILEREDLDSDLFRRRGADRSIDPVRYTADVDYARKDDNESQFIDKLRLFLMDN
jgi:CheY-like chemotaxis protein